MGWMWRPLCFAVIIDGRAIPLWCWLYMKCPILLEPLYISIHTTTYSKCPLELVQHFYETVLYNSDCFFVCVFKQKVLLFHVLRWLYRLCISHSAMASEAPRLGHPRRSTHSYCHWHVHRARSELRLWTLSRKSRSSSILSWNHWHIIKCFSM